MKSHKIIHTVTIIIIHNVRIKDTVKLCLFIIFRLVLNIKPHCADEKHLFPHVEFPGNVRISVIFLTAPAVELSLNDVLLNWQLSGH